VLANEKGIEKEYYFLATKNMIYRIELNIRPTDDPVVRNQAQMIFDTLQFN
jgi:hypothetical protein